MTHNERTRKLSALNKFLQGKPQAVHAMKPPMVVDLEQFNGEELLALSRYGQVYEQGKECTAELAEVERLLAGRELKMIPAPQPYRFIP